eukprot:5005978-Prymnesium_polylepis.1
MPQDAQAVGARTVHVSIAHRGAQPVDGLQHVQMRYWLWKCHWSFEERLKNGYSASFDFIM